MQHLGNMVSKQAGGVIFPEEYKYIYRSWNSMDLDEQDSELLKKAIAISTVNKYIYGCPDS